MSNDKKDMLKPSGRPAVDNGDAVSHVLNGLSVDEVFDRAVTLMAHYQIPVTKEELEEEYGHLSDAMKRQNVGNKIRSAIRKAGFDPKVVLDSTLTKIIIESLKERVNSLEESLWALEEDDEFYRNRFEDIEFRLKKAEERLEPLDGLS